MRELLGVFRESVTDLGSKVFIDDDPKEFPAHNQKSYMLVHDDGVAFAELFVEYEEEKGPDSKTDYRYVKLKAFIDKSAMKAATVKTIDKNRYPKFLAWMDEHIPSSAALQEMHLLPPHPKTEKSEEDDVEVLRKELAESKVKLNMATAAYNKIGMQLDGAHTFLLAVLRDMALLEPNCVARTGTDCKCLPCLIRTFVASL